MPKNSIHNSFNKLMNELMNLTKKVKTSTMKALWHEEIEETIRRRKKTSCAHWYAELIL